MSTPNTSGRNGAGETGRTVKPEVTKRPVSEARLRANRENAKKSTGPRSEQGKQRSRQNAARHHFTTEVIPLPEHELELLNQCIQQFIAEYEPVGNQETHLVHMLAHTQYRLHRLAYAEHHVLTSGSVADAPSANKQEAVRGMAEILRRSKDPILTLSIYEQRLMRQYERTLNMLLDLQGNRKAEERQQESDLYVVARCHAVANVPFDPSEFGFVSSEDEIHHLIKRRVTIDRSRHAREQGFESEYCKAATYYSR